MKKIIFVSFSFFCTINVVNAQVPVKPGTVKPVTPTIRASNCCKENPFLLHPCAQSLIQSYKNLVAGTGVTDCGPSPQTHNVSSAMQTAGFSHSTNPGYLTFISFYRDGYTYFHNIWGGEAGNFTYYGACVPSPIVFTLPPITQNHVFNARLISVAAYRAFTGTKTYPGLAGVGEVRIQDIQAIREVYLESANGYIAGSEPANYNSIYSSKGIVCNVLLRGRTTTEKYYLINNYDLGGTIAWKTNNYCEGN